MSEKHEDKRIFINSIQSFFRSPVEQFNIIQVEQKTKKKKARMVIEIPESLATGLFKNMTGDFFVPIRGLFLNWAEYRKEGETNEPKKGER